MKRSKVNLANLGGGGRWEEVLVEGVVGDGGMNLEKAELGGLVAGQDFVKERLTLTH